jgi:hypothetical protein
MSAIVKTQLHSLAQVICIYLLLFYNPYGWGVSLEGWEMRKIVALLVATGISFGVVGCGGGDAKKPDAPKPTEVKEAAKEGAKEGAKEAVKEATPPAK